MFDKPTRLLTAAINVPSRSILIDCIAASGSGICNQMKMKISGVKHTLKSGETIKKFYMLAKSAQQMLNLFITPL